MAKVLTLDGLPVTRLAGKRRTCAKTVEVYSPVLEKEVLVCAEDMPKRKPGRPRGTTVKRGARKPRVPACKVARYVETKTGRKVCRCTDAGNKQIVTNSRCERSKQR